MTPKLTDHKGQDGIPGNQISMKVFLETVPPRVQKRIAYCVSKMLSGMHSQSTAYQLNLPVLELYCQTCDGERRFNINDAIYLDKDKDKPKRTQRFVTYRCRNCMSFTKTYAIRVDPQDDDKSVDIYKFGEEPAFGRPTPARVASLLAEEKEYFLKGRQAENQGMGIAAFAYYRRVIENKKGTLIDEILRVAQKLGAGKAVIEDLRAAKRKKQFSTAVESIRHGIPDSLMVGGIHNPLILLHSALSEGLHAKTDEACLELATNIRIVLISFVERLALAMKDEVELNAAVSKLLGSPSQTTTRP